MPSIIIHLHDNDPAPRADALDGSSCGFVAVRIGDISLYLAGEGATCVAHTRRFAEALNRAATELEQSIKVPA